MGIAEYKEMQFYQKDPHQWHFLRENETNTPGYVMSDGTRGHDHKLIDGNIHARQYYLFVKHCYEREVDFTPLVEAQAKVVNDRRLKLGDAPHQHIYGLTDAP